MTQRVFGVYFLRAINLLLDLLTNFVTACSSVRLHRQLKTRLALSLAVEGSYKFSCSLIGYFSESNGLVFGQVN